MRVLAVDTSSERGSICIAEDGDVLGEVRIASSVQHSDRLFRSVEFLLDYVPFRLSDIDVFVAARGPGSFTGLRIGLAAMEGFAKANNRRGVGVSTLEALAWKANVENVPIAAVIDARRGEVYAALYRRTGNDLIVEKPPTVVKPDVWFSALPNSAMVMCGSGAHRYREFINRAEWTLSDTDLYLASTIAQLASTSYCGPLEPLYVRKTDAEIAREGRHESVGSPSTKS
jgi:tRNA threonylcarbamoyladenosine biosynthesis protein TsaB